MQVHVSDLGQLWVRARAMFARAADELGGPDVIAALAASMRPLNRGLRRSMVRWLVRLEHIVRKLLFAEAARLPPGSAADTGAVAASAPCAGRASAAQPPIDLHDPESWPVRFSLAVPPDPGAPSESCAPVIRSLSEDSPASPAPSSPRLAPRQEPAIRLARRFEALRRVLTNPAPYAMRLARIMRRLARRFADAPLRYASTVARVEWFDRADPRLPIDAYATALAAPRFDSG
jgi:hypothetical protein